MSKPLDLQSGTGRVATFGGKSLIVIGDAVIADGTAGYLPGCILIDKTNGVVYINEGSVTSSDFDAISTV